MYSTIFIQDLIYWTFLLFSPRTGLYTLHRFPNRQQIHCYRFVLLNEPPSCKIGHETLQCPHLKQSGLSTWVFIFLLWNPATFLFRLVGCFRPMDIFFHPHFKLCKVTMCVCGMVSRARYSCVCDVFFILHRSIKHYMTKCCVHNLLIVI